MSAKANKYRPIRMWGLTWKRSDTLLSCIRETRRAVVAEVQDIAAPNRWRETWGVVPVMVRRLK